MQAWGLVRLPGVGERGRGTEGADAAPDDGHIDVAGQVGEDLLVGNSPEGAGGDLVGGWELGPAMAPTPDSECVEDGDDKGGNEPEREKDVVERSRKALK